MLHKTQAIVLHSLRYGDSSLIVHAFTRQWGRKAFLIKGARKSKRSNRSNMFQPLFILDMDVYYKESRDLQWIREASFVDKAPAFSNDITCSTQALFLAEVLMKCLKEEEANTAIYDFISNSVEYLNSLDNASPSFHLVFLFQLSRYLGFYPMNNYSIDLNFFSAEAGSFSQFPVSANLELEMKLGTLWKDFFRVNYMTVDQVVINKDQRNHFLNSLLDFYRFHMPEMGEIKTLDVLRTVFE